MQGIGRTWRGMPQFAQDGFQFLVEPGQEISHSGQADHFLMVASVKMRFEREIRSDSQTFLSVRPVILECVAAAALSRGQIVRERAT